MGEGEGGMNCESSIEAYISPGVEEMTGENSLCGTGSSDMVLCNNIKCGIG